MACGRSCLASVTECGPKVPQIVVGIRAALPVDQQGLASGDHQHERPSTVLHTSPAEVQQGWADVWKASWSNRRSFLGLRDCPPGSHGALEWDLVCP